MKICMVSYHCCPFSLVGGNGVGGMNVYLKELSSHLTEFPDLFIDIFTRIQSHRFRSIHNISPSLRVVHLKGGPEQPFDRRDLYDYLPEFSRNLEDFILAEDTGYDLVYSHYWLSGLAGTWIKSRFNLPLVHTYHTLGFLKERALGRSEHECRDRIETLLASVADTIISSSFEESSHLNERYRISPSGQTVIHPGVNKNLFYPVLEEREICQEAGWDEDSMRLLYVGRIEPIKGLMSVVESMARIKQADPSFYAGLRLAVIGGGHTESDFMNNPEFVRIQNFVRENNLQTSVKFLGSKKQDVLREYYSAADALIVPSLYESFGLVVVEALACGTPVLVSKIGKMQSIVKEGKSGFSFKPGSIASLHECLQRFLSCRDSLWDRDSIRKDVVERFSWKKTAQETHEVLVSLARIADPVTTTLQAGESLQPGESFLLRPCP